MAKKSGDLWKRIKHNRLLYVLLSGAVVWAIVFEYAPMVGIVMAFQDYDIFKGVFGSPFVGMKHFVEIIETPALSHAVVNTLLYSGVKLVLGFPLTIVLALLLNELRFMLFKRIVQTISYMPHFLSWIAVASLAYSFFELYGPFNDLRMSIFGSGTERTNILMEPDNFLGLIFFSSVYKEIGWSTIIFLAAMAGVDPQLYEAAKVDGCSRLKQVFYVTLPGILPTIMIVFILQAGGILNANFEQIIGFQNLYTQKDTEVINTIVYKYGLQQGKFSLATAFGLAQGVCSFLILYAVNKLAKKTSRIGIW
ncbi:ABC transporter permease [Cohnella fermenti]|nr:ABC transporter permease subunit [Cohnella fermenti]